MNIAVSFDYDKTDIENFSELEDFCFELAMKFGRELMVKLLKAKDAELMLNRDSNRYRAKGLQKTCVKTKLGDVEYERRVYIDNAVAEGVHCVHLLDKEMNAVKVGMYSSGAVGLMVNAITGTTYRGAAEIVSDATGLNMSSQALWNVVQKVGKSQLAVTDRLAELAKTDHGTGVIETKILYEENDGVYISMQGKDRPASGSSKEMKVGIAYDGTVCSKGKNGEKRRILDNKVAYAGFVSADEFRKRKEGIVASRFDVDSVDLRVCNGDGAGWVQKYEGEDRVIVLDAFHRNKKIKECVKDPEFASLLRNLLYEQKYDDLLICIDAQINSVEDEAEADNLRTLYNYYNENKEYLSGYYDRDIEIPETRDPENIQHARLGGMESNIFTLIANRMKGKRRNWSINGANNLAIILCAKHTTGLDNLFAAMPEMPEVQSELSDEELAFINSPIPSGRDYSDGKGYELPHNMSTTNAPYPFLREMSLFSSLSDISF